MDAAAAGCSAFPLYASVAWLVWVVSQQAGPPGVAAALAGLVLIALRRVAPRPRARQRRARGARVTSVIALGARRAGGRPRRAGGSRIGRADARLGLEQTDGWEPFSRARLAELRAAGTPVVRQHHRRVVPHVPRQRAASRCARRPSTDASRRKGVVTLKADWTRRDPVITQVLGTFGRNGVPLYLLYPAGGATREPAVLPQILSERIAHRRDQGGSMIELALTRRTFLAGTGLAVLARRQPRRCAAGVGRAERQGGHRRARLHDRRDQRQAREPRRLPRPDSSCSSGRITTARTCASTTTPATCRRCRRRPRARASCGSRIISSAPGTQGFVSAGQADELTTTRKASPDRGAARSDWHGRQDVRRRPTRRTCT